MFAVIPSIRKTFCTTFFGWQSLAASPPFSQLLSKNISSTA